MDPVQRRLVAIPAADMVGYSRLMREGRGRHACPRQGAAKHRVRVVQLNGNCAVVEFANVVNGLQ